MPPKLLFNFYFFILSNVNFKVNNLKGKKKKGGFN